MLDSDSSLDYQINVNWFAGLGTQNGESIPVTPNSITVKTTVYRYLDTQGFPSTLQLYRPSHTEYPNPQNPDHPFPLTGSSGDLLITAQTLETLPDGFYHIYLEIAVFQQGCPVSEDVLVFDVSVGTSYRWRCAQFAEITEVRLDFDFSYYIPTFKPHLTFEPTTIYGLPAELIRGIKVQESVNAFLTAPWKASVIQRVFTNDFLMDPPVDLEITRELVRFTDSSYQTFVVEEERHTIFQTNGPVDPTFLQFSGGAFDDLTFGELEAGVYLLTLNVNADPPSSNEQINDLCELSPYAQFTDDYLAILVVGEANDSFVKHPNGTGCTKECADPINPHTGAFSHTETDIQIPGRSLDFVFTRVHNSNFVHFDSPLGYAWWSPYFQRLYRTEQETLFPGTEPHILLYKSGEGRNDTYLFDEQTQQWLAPGHIHKDVVFDEQNSQIILVGDNETKYFFHDFTHPSAKGRLAAIEDRFGNRISLVYDETLRSPDGDVLILKIIDTYQREIVFEHNIDGFIKSITDFKGRRWDYRYYPEEFQDPYGGEPYGGSEFGSLRDLSVVLYPEVVGNEYQHDYSEQNRKKRRYRYDKAHPHKMARHAVTEIQDENGKWYLKNTYSQVADSNDFLFGRVLAQDYGKGSFKLHYEPNPTSLPSGAENAVLLFIENDRRGLVSETYYTATGNAVLERHYTGFAPDLTAPTTPSSNRPTGKLRSSDPEFFETRHEFNADGLPTQTINPDGDRSVTEYNTSATKRHGQNNATSVGKRTSSNSDPALVSTFTYEPLFQKVKTSTDPKGNTTTYFFDYEEASLGDLNGDSGTGSSKGLIVRTEYPDVTEGIAANQAGGSQKAFEQIQYNAFGQVTKQIDAEGKVVAYQYYPSNDPDGDGVVVAGNSDASEGGYLESIVVDPSGLALTTSYKYDLVGNTIEQTDAKGEVFQFIYNDSDQMVKSISPVLSTFEADGGATYETITFYDANGNIDKTWVELENSFEDSDANVSGFESPNHFETQFTYDKLDNLVSMKQEVINHPEMAGSHTTLYFYDNSDNLVRTAYSDSASAEEDKIVYDERNLVFKKIIGSSGAEPTIIRYNYTKNGKLAKKIYPLPKHHEIYEYDDYDRLESIKNAIGSKVTYQYDNNSNVTETSLRGEQFPTGPSILLTKTQVSYDERDRSYLSKFFHRDLALNQPLGVLIDKVGYNRNNLVFRTVNSNTHATNLTYDSADRLTQVQDALGNQTQSYYDQNSNLITKVSREKDQSGTLIGTYTQTLRYDELNRLRETEDDLDNVTYFNLDSRGLTTLKMDAEAHIHRMRYDGLGREFSKLMDAQNGPIQHGKVYDNRSRLIKSIDGDNFVTEYFYDHQGRLTRKINAQQKMKDYFYDEESNLVRLVRENGDIIDNSYDKLNRLVNIQYKNSAEQVQIEDAFAYDGLNQQLSLQTRISSPGVNAGSQISFEKDNRGLSLSTTQEIYHPIQGVYLPAKTFRATYNNVGNPVSATYPGGRTLSFSGYNKIELLGQLKTNGYDNAFAGQQDLAQYEYHGYGRLFNKTTGNNYRIEATYDPIKRISALNHRKLQTNQVTVGFTQTYNKVHSVRAQTYLDQQNGVQDARVYELDAYQRATGFIKNLPTSLVNQALTNFSSVQVSQGRDHQNITYDHRNNINQIQLEGSTVAFTNNEMSETSAISGKRSNITYDDLGRTTSYLEGGNSYQLFWNPRDQLVSVVKNGAELARYEYYPSPSPMRSLKLYPDGRGESFYGTGSFIQELYDLDISGTQSPTPSKEWIYEGLDNPLVLFTNKDQDSFTGALGGREAYFYHSNPRGDVYALSNANGDIIERYDYTLFGEVEITDALYNPIPLETTANPFFFGGAYRDLETSYTYMRHRFYDPLMRKFLSRDPAEDDSLSNLYAAFENNPGLYRDPSGMFVQALKGLAWSTLQLIAEPILLPVDAVKALGSAGASLVGIDVDVTMYSIIGSRQQGRVNVGQHFVEAAAKGAGEAALLPAVALAAGYGSLALGVTVATAEIIGVGAGVGAGMAYGYREIYNEYSEGKLSIDQLEYALGGVGALPTLIGVGGLAGRTVLNHFPRVGQVFGAIEAGIESRLPNWYKNARTKVAAMSAGVQTFAKNSLNKIASKGKCKKTKDSGSMGSECGASPSFTRVGRWMSQAEYDAMVTSGRVQPTLTGLELKSVSQPPNPASYSAANPGSIFVEFDVPTAQLTQGGTSLWQTIFGPNSIHGRLATKRGSNLPPGMPEVKNISITSRK
jgi:RHS repeat-associated protein